MSAAAAAGMTVRDAFKLAVEHEQAGRFDAAESLLNQLLATVPDQPDALHLLGVVAARREDFSEAARLIERAMRSNSNPALHNRNICEIYRRLGRLDDAVAAGERAVALNPSDPHSLVNLAIILYDCGRYAEGAACSERAIALAPELAGAHFELAEALLVQGQFSRGWDEYEWRFQIAGATRPIPATDKPLWDGTALDGTLLLVADQGFGDVIQFGRLIPWARRNCPDVIVASARDMHPILRQIAPDVRIFDRWENVPDYAAYSSLSGLPRLYGVRQDNIPAAAPSLRADAARSAEWRRRVEALVPRGNRRVGIVWAGRPTHNNDFNRSIRLDQLAPLASVPGLALLALQKGAGAAEIGRYFGRAPLLNLGPELRDYDDTMAVLEHIDLLITVDTSVAHLAGAMNRPAWVMLPFAPDWRWLTGRTDTPWYPSLHLWRQKRPGAWDEVIAAIAARLAATG